MDRELVAEWFRFKNRNTDYAKLTIFVAKNGSGEYNNLIKLVNNIRLEGKL